MRRRKGSSFSGRHRLRGQVVRWALLAAVVVLVLALLAVKVGSELLFPSFWS